INLNFQTALSNFISSIGVGMVEVTTSFNTALSNFTTLTSNLTLNLINAFSTTITNVANSSISKVNNIISKFNKLANKVIEDSTKVKQIAYDFYNRIRGESSTSKYIQTNVPDLNGLLKKNVNILKNTPDKVIIEPNLKSDINNVKKNVTNPLTSLLSSFGGLPKITSLIP
ncbi:hypothetical protein, partial [Clostridium sp.]|uniref:hypothetical protein n=1 Tax=Clostridium sp. TaxID=1506 RepID=UPI0026241F62